MNPGLVIFPVPLRVVSLCWFSLLCWAFTLHSLLRSANFNPTQLFNSNSNSISILNSTQTQTLHPAAYYATLSLGILILLGLLTNQLISNLDLLQPQHHQLIHLISALPAFTLLLTPFRLAPFSTRFRSSHRRLRSIFIRLFTFHFPPHALTPFSHVIFADFLTSLARPLAHLSIFLSGLLHLHPDYRSSLSLAFNCLPYLLRLKHCINDAIVGPGTSKSILNGLKYTTAIPMLIFGSKLHPAVSSKASSAIDLKESESSWTLWIVASAINSGYSSWWDIVNDWGIGRKEVAECITEFREQFSPDPLPIPRHEPYHHPTSPRQVRIILSRHKWGYLVLVLLNCMLRMTWMVGAIKRPETVGPRLEFMLEVLEIVRRAMWCFVRLEWAEMNRKKEDEYYVDLGYDLGPADDSGPDDPIDDDEKRPDLSPDSLLSPALHGSLDRKPSSADHSQTLLHLHPLAPGNDSHSPHGFSAS